MPAVRVASELEHGPGWIFTVEFASPESPQTPLRRELTLSWADHERWTGGARPPSEVAARVALFAARRGLLPRLGPRFDASTVRRLDPDLEPALADWAQDAGWS
ncbi:MAG: hypothetical protein IBJ10_08090 [Phycisphaerales bacterium]|nr:hypothetical protein [Phycisphaerales bacterium]